MFSGAPNSLCSTPEFVFEESMTTISASPFSDLSSQGSEEVEEVMARRSENGNTNETPENYIKRPMNAFLWFSKQYRGEFKTQYPGRDNREISTILAKHWRGMTPEQKEPFKERAREEMRRTRESYPDFKYCKTKKETTLAPALTNSCEKQDGWGQGYRIGSHNLRHRNAIICTTANGKGKTPVTKKEHTSCEQFGLKPKGHQTKVESETTAPGTTDKASTTAEDKIKMMTKNSTPTQNEEGGTVSNCLKDQIKNSCQDGASGAVSKFEWQSTSCDTWVQCENCKRWHMLPDDSNPSSLPEKWYCCPHVDYPA
ncbi:transcription factor Sox-13-like [Stylophora pistillata]|nr:transcription factor Sox-13-like [Stylophora pistillata]